MRYVDLSERTLSGSGSTDMASAKGFLPYAIVGYNFGLFDVLTLGGGAGLGYSFLEVSGVPDDYNFKGLALVGEFNLTFIL